MGMIMVIDKPIPNVINDLVVNIIINYRII